MAMRIVCMMIINGVESLKAPTTVTGAEPTFVLKVPGVGKPFMAFDVLPGTLIGAEFGPLPDLPDVPLVSLNTTENKNNIEMMRQHVEEYMSRLQFA